MDVECRWRFIGGVVVELLNGDGEDGWVIGENGRGSVAVMHIAVDYHGALDQAIALRNLDRDCYVIDGAESLAMSAIGVMKSAADVVTDALFQCHLGRERGSARGCNEGARHLFRPRDLQSRDFEVTQRSGFQAFNPTGVMCEQQVVIRSGLRLHEILWGSGSIGQEPLADQTEFLRGG